MSPQSIQGAVRGKDSVPLPIGMVTSTRALLSFSMNYIGITGDASS
jgi:hypothetical protein